MSLALIDSPALEPQPAADRSRQALDYVHRLLQRSTAEQWSLATVLQGLAEAFAARTAGLANTVEQRGTTPDAVNLPWEADPEVQTRIANTPDAVSFSRPGKASWLVSGIWNFKMSPWLLWLEDNPQRTWSDGERAALVLAAQVLGRLALSGTNATAWSRCFERAQFQNRIEHAAVVSGRLAHDFGNILTGILGFAELSLTQLPADSLPRSHVQEVCHSAQRGAEWLRKLQVFSRRHRSKGPPCQIEPVVSELETRLRAAWAPDVSFLVSLPDHLPGVAIDMLSLRQLVEQLLHNAREAISGQGVVTLTGRTVRLREDDCLDLLGNAAPGLHVELTITDTGTGISPETRRRLCHDVFFSTKTRQRGLGLPMTYGILHANRGAFRFGPDPEQGTAVRVFLPCVRVAESPEMKPAVVSSGTRLLVVDDDPMVLEFVRRVLENAGHQVQTASGPVQALEQYTARAHDYRLIISDIAMPVMNGLQLARKLQAINGNASFLFITSQNSGVLAGDDKLKDSPILKKPFDPAGLIQAVSAALAAKKN